MADHVRFMPWTDNVVRQQLPNAAYPTERDWSHAGRSATEANDDAFSDSMGSGDKPGLRMVPRSYLRQRSYVFFELTIGAFVRNTDESGF